MQNSEGVEQGSDKMLPLWRPTSDQIEATAIDRFRRHVLPDSSDSGDLWRWSVAEAGPFWRSVWDWFEIRGHAGENNMAHGDLFWKTRFLPDATLNVAENLLADRPGAADPAIVAADEDGSSQDLSWDDLRSQVGSLAAALRAQGVGSGDRVAAWMPHRAETIVIFLAAASIGAVFTSTSADFGVDGVVDRFGQTKPKVLLAADGYRYGGRTFPLLDRLGAIVTALPSIETVVVVGALTPRPDLNKIGMANQAEGTQGTGPRLLHWLDILAQYAGEAPSYEQLPADHALYILYSSGTTGKPKCIVHRSGGVLLKHLTEQGLHSDIRAGDRVFFFTTCGWMMWNWLVSCLGLGATIVLYDGDPAYPSMSSLFELAERQRVNLFGVSAKFIDSTMKSGYRPMNHHDLSSIRTVCSTGSPLSQEGFCWVYDSVSPEVHLASISGGTDLCGCLVLGDPTMPVYAGEIQRPALGLDIEIFDEAGQALGPGLEGELVCANAFPSMPLAFWADDEDLRYRRAYFERFPNVWAQGDFASWTDRHGMIIHGRSDATLNASGVRIGTAEIYGVVEQLPQVAEAIAIGQKWESDTRIVLFVRLSDGVRLDDDLQKLIRSELRTKRSPRHVPGVIVEVDDIPRTRSGKIVEMAVTEMVHGRSVQNLEALANPEALAQFSQRPELG